MPEYRNNPTYIALETLIRQSGVSIKYSDVYDDPIDGAIWARADYEGRMIMMPDTDEFPDAQTATLILGHEMGHILSGLDSPDDPIQRRINEATCDQIGAYLSRLAEMIAGFEAEQIFNS